MATGAPDYFKRILLYGMYNGQAVPLACDEQGRVIFIAEKVSPYDKSGTILVEETFESGLVHVRTETQGDGAAVTIEAGEAAFGGHSCKLTGGKDGQRYARILIPFPVGTASKLGLDWHMRLDDYIEMIEINLQLRTTSWTRSGTLRYEKANTRWVLWDDITGALVTIASGQDYADDQNYFYRFKLIINPVTQRYERFRYGPHEVDLSDYGLTEYSEAGYDQGYLYILAKSESGQNGFALIDNIIITQDES